MNAVDINAMLLDGLKYMGIGIGVVFVVILVFFVVIKIMMKIWPAK
jgi:hypothetical protein